MGIAIIILIIILALIISFAIGNHILAGKCNISHDMSGKLIIITGASSGLWKYTALELVNKGAKVIFACRNEEKTNKIINNEINEKNRHLGIFEKIDLSSFQSVINFTERIKKKYQKIDILLNNAGNAPDYYRKTEDGFETFIQCNFLGHVVLTYLLMDHMNQNGRIINLSSLGHNYCVFNKEMIEKIYDCDFDEKYFFGSIWGRNNLYNLTKLMMIYFTHELNEYFNKKKYFSKSCESSSRSCEYRIYANLSKSIMD